MNAWIKDHAWPLIIALVGVITSFSLYGYRIEALEKRSDAQQVQIEAVKEQQIDIEVQLAQIAVDITYIKEGIQRLTR